MPNVRVQLVPGEPETALRRVANSLAGTDLFLIAATQDPQSLSQAWTWMPRMLTQSSLIFQEEAGDQSAKARWRQLSLQEVQQRAGAANRGLRRAA